MTAVAERRAGAGPASVELRIGGMTCAACADRIERTLNALDGVLASVDHTTATARVHYPAGLDPAALVAQVRAAGYTAALPVDGAPDATAVDPERALRQRLLVCSALAAPVVVLSVVPALQFSHWQWIALTLAAPVVAWGAWPFHRAAATGLRHGAATADTLVSISTLAASGWSLHALLLGSAGAPGAVQPLTLTAAPTNALYLGIAAGVTVLALGGRRVEARAERASRAARRALLDPGACAVAPLTAAGARRMSLSAPAAGDTVVAGRAGADASPASGAAARVGADPGTAVDGLHLLRAGGAPQRGTAAVRRPADRVAGVLVPVVIALAVGTLGFWLGSGAAPAAAVAAAVAVLIIACPSALLLAAPTALLAGTGRGARLGVSITGPEVLAAARRVDTLVLDAAGTLTSGRMGLAAVHPVEGGDGGEALRLAGAVGQGAQHPVGAAIATAARERFGELPGVSEFDSLPGRGVRGLVSELVPGPDGALDTVRAHAVLVGRPALLDEHGVDLPEELAAALAAAAAAGTTAVVVAWDGEARAVLAVGDTVRPDAAAAVARLRRLGLRPLLVTGDHPAVALRVAHAVGIPDDDVAAGVPPEGRVERVRALRADGHVVAMIGDGAAAATADLGIATGSDAATADLTLAHDGLAAAVDAIRLARRTRAVLRDNLLWALAGTVAAVPLAAAGLLSPMIAGLVMLLSPVLVVTDTVRLRRSTPLRHDRRSRSVRSPIVATHG